jgi:hypothetical protein
MSEAKSAEAQIKDTVWTYGGWFVLLSLTLGAGIALGYIFWGDALLLRKENAELKQKVRIATDEKDNALTQRTMAQEELGRCEKRLAAAAQPAAPTGSAVH